MPPNHTERPLRVSVWANIETQFATPPHDDAALNRSVTVINLLVRCAPALAPMTAIRSGSAMVFVRVRDNPPLIDVFSPILTDVEASEKLYAKLSELTTKMPIGRLYQANKTVWASVPVA